MKETLDTIKKVKVTAKVVEIKLAEYRKTYNNTDSDRTNKDTAEVVISLPGSKVQYRVLSKNEYISYDDRTDKNVDHIYKIYSNDPMFNLDTLALAGITVDWSEVIAGHKALVVEYEKAEAIRRKAESAKRYDSSPVHLVKAQLAPWGTVNYTKEEYIDREVWSSPALRYERIYHDENHFERVFKANISYENTRYNGLKWRLEDGNTYKYIGTYKKFENLVRRLEKLYEDFVQVWKSKNAAAKRAAERKAKLESSVPYDITEYSETIASHIGNRRSYDTYKRTAVIFTNDPEKYNGRGVTFNKDLEKNTYTFRDVHGTFSEDTFKKIVELIKNEAKDGSLPFELFSSLKKESK